MKDLNEYKPETTIENDNFIIVYNKVDKGIIKEVLESLEDNYRRISSHLKETAGGKVKIEIQHNLKEMHKALGFPDAPDWIRGGLGRGRIIIASPLNPPLGSRAENVINTAVHEFTHFIIHKINMSIPRWLDEGIASFEAKDNNENWIVKTVSTGIKMNKVPSFDYLDTKEDFNEFFKRDGYQYSYTIIQFIVDTFGYDKLGDFIRNPEQYKEVFGVDKKKLQDNWKKYISEKYK